MFLNVFVHFLCKCSFGNNITKVAKQEDIKIHVSSSREVNLDSSAGVLAGLLNTLA